MKKFLPLWIVFAFLFIGCSSDDDGGEVENPNPNPVTSADFPVQSFMWNAMNFWYFWQSSVPDLADDRFANDQEFAEFLAADPEPLDFYTGIQFNEDRFSFSNPDFRTLVNNLNGISRSNGLEFGLVRFQDSDDVFGYVQYIIPDSDAAGKDIQRGDIFTRVDGQQLTVGNFRELLFGENVTYTLGLATIDDGTVTDTDEEVSLTKMEGLLENPILVARTLDFNGQRVAYLMYNGFRRDFDTQLNDAFAQFVAEGATELVLDFRYNGGGSVNSSRLLSSMVYGPNTNDLFLRQRWNEKIQPQFSDEQLEDFFASTVNGAALNSLELDRVFVLTTNRTASASELVINGLDPYVQVIQIGETTSGKNEFSITLVDDPDNSFIFNPDREDNINPEVSWALQPLVGRNENAVGFLDYTDGFTPDIVLEEDLANLGVLGEADEPLLARALQEIAGGVSARASFEVQMPISETIGDSKMFAPVKGDFMYLDKPISFK